MVDNSATILVVDDNQDLRDLVQLFLDSSGCKILTAPDGPSALTIIATHKVDLVLLDVMMPGISGLETLQRIRADQRPEIRALPVVMITAKAASEDIESALSLGAHSYIIKPFRGSHLREKVQEILGGPTEAVMEVQE
jgi:CheY-like chemotaxis protein